MVAKTNLWFSTLYSLLKSKGVKTDSIASRLKMSRTALRLWFDSGILDARRANLVAGALEDLSTDILKIARALRKGFES